MPYPSSLNCRPLTRSPPGQSTPRLSWRSAVAVGSWLRLREPRDLTFCRLVGSDSQPSTRSRRFAASDSQPPTRNPVRHASSSRLSRHWAPGAWRRPPMIPGRAAISPVASPSSARRRSIRHRRLPPLARCSRNMWASERFRAWCCDEIALQVAPRPGDRGAAIFSLGPTSWDTGVGGAQWVLAQRNAS
jgi:hypothetical protein